MNKKIFFLIVLPILAILLGISVGSVYMSPYKIIMILSNQLLSLQLPAEISDGDVAIIYYIRLPRVLLAFVVGGSLAMSGAAIQSLLRNPLASPYTLGVSSGASLGVALVISFQITSAVLGNMFLPVVGFASSLLSVTLIMYLANKLDRNYSTNTIILTGIVFSLFMNGVLTLIIALSGDELKNIIFWQMGSLSLKGYSHLLGIVPFALIGGLGLLFYHRELDGLAFGEEHASNIGIDTKKMKRTIILLSSILTGSAIAVSGIIGFIGLIAPHIIRRIVGYQHKVVLPLSFAFGGVFLIITDLIARTIVRPSEIPVGAITALIGAPFFAFIFFYRKR